MNSDTKPDGVGYLVINTVTARGAIPIVGAALTVYASEIDGRPIIAEAVSGSGGRTERLELPAPALGLSMSPGSEKPYTTYSVSARKSGYYPVTLSDVPIFPGIVSSQQIELIPLAEYDSESVYPSPATELTEREPNDL